MIPMFELVVSVLFLDSVLLSIVSFFNWLQITTTLKLGQYWLLFFNCVFSKRLI